MRVVHTVNALSGSVFVGICAHSQLVVRVGVCAQSFCPIPAPRALERFGSLFVERSVGLTVSNCKWTRASGNGISINRFNLNATVEDSAFEWMGGSAIAAWGFTDGPCSCLGCGRVKVMAGKGGWVRLVRL